MNDKEIMYQFVLSLWRDGWISLTTPHHEYTSVEFKEWFEIQYKSRLASFEKKQLESKHT